ncbi:MAG TPA: right-handed parallel beta-helix repeat-containing protein, partial [Candidatus Binatus sp.]|nr:right-handed parallel beta-helix repeat-containing protein [Candidatus Binatus sp.]
MLLLVVLILGTFIVSSSILVVHAGTIHVPGDYPTIQKAINAANVNDTVLVSAGTYSELVSLNRTVHLVGVDKTSTVLDGGGAGTVVNVTANGATIAGFTIQNAVVDAPTVELFRVKNVNITGNIIISNPKASRPTGAGVDLFKSNNTLIDRNVFSQNLYAVNITGSTLNRISNNQMITGDPLGVEITEGSRNVIIGNSFASDEEGVDLNGASSNFNNITRNL